MNDLILTFDEKTHTYYVGEKKLISVTQLMQKHGLSPNYSDIPVGILQAKAERGTIIHKEIESYIKTGEVGFTTELLSFIDWIKEHPEYEIVDCEVMVNNDIVAGCIDLVLYNKLTNEYVIADHKTTATLHKEAVSWQESIYRDLYSIKQIYKGNVPNRYILVNGLRFADNGLCFWYKNDGSLEVKEISTKPTSEINKLFECEREGETFKQELSVVDALALEVANGVMKVAELKTAIEKIEEVNKQLQDQLLKAMVGSGLYSIDTDEFKITKIDAYQKESIDTKKLKEQYPSIAKELTKITNVKETLKITLRGNK